MALRYREVVDRPLFSSTRGFAWRMGVRGLADDDWLQPDDRRDADLHEKDHLTERIREQVFAAQPGTTPAAGAVRDLVAGGLRRHGLALRKVGNHPLETAGLSVQEDLCLLEPRGATWVLTAGSVCFPTRWDLSSVIGSSLAAIHVPVPGYERIETAVDGFFARLAPGALAHRFNWSLVGDPARRLPPDVRQAPARLPVDPATGVYLRVERQTLRRLATHDAIVFGIRVHVWPLAEVLDDLPAGALAHTLETMPDDVARYKNLDGLRADLLAWLGGDGPSSRG